MIDAHARRPLSGSPLAPSHEPVVRPLHVEALPDLVAGCKTWGRLRVPLSSRVTVSLWVLLAALVPLAAGLVAVLAGAVTFGGPAYTVATLGDRPVLQLMLAVIGVVGLLGAAVTTHRLTEASGPELAVIVVAVIAGGVSLAGVVTILVLGAVSLALAVLLLAAVADRF